MTRVALGRPDKAGGRSRRPGAGRPLAPSLHPPTYPARAAPAAPRVPSRRSAAQPPGHGVHAQPPHAPGGGPPLRCTPCIALSLRWCFPISSETSRASRRDLVAMVRLLQSPQCAGRWASDSGAGEAGWRRAADRKQAGGEQPNAGNIPGLKSLLVAGPPPHPPLAPTDPCRQALPPALNPQPQPNRPHRH